MGVGPFTDDKFKFNYIFLSVFLAVEFIASATCIPFPLGVLGGSMTYGVLSTTFASTSAIFASSIIWTTSVVTWAGKVLCKAYLPLGL